MQCLENRIVRILNPVILFWCFLSPLFSSLSLFFFSSVLNTLQKINHFNSLKGGIFICTCTQTANSYVAFFFVSTISPTEGTIHFITEARLVPCLESEYFAYYCVKLSILSLGAQHLLSAAPGLPSSSFLK